MRKFPEFADKKKFEALTESELEQLETLIGISESGNKQG
jgi:hypothetical protein